jgi:hypothetical protein
MSIANHQFFLYDMESGNKRAKSLVGRTLCNHITVLSQLSVMLDLSIVFK